VTIAFDLHFEPLTLRTGVVLAAPPALSLSAPDAGWMHWRIEADDAAATICMSHLHPPLASIWAWAAAIAHRLLPVTLRIEEEGFDSLLCAKTDDANGDLHLTLWQRVALEGNYLRLIWRENRVDWLRRLGELFGNHLGESFNVAAWQNGTYWPEPAQYLPWDWPATVASHTASACEPESVRTWFFLLLAHMLDPHVLRNVWYPQDMEKLARLSFLLARERLAALRAAWNAAGIRQPFPSDRRLDERLSAARDLFEEMDVMRKNGNDHESPAELRDASARDRALNAAAINIELELHALLHQAEESLFRHFPLAPGQWLLDERFRPGRILQVTDDRVIVDWGEVGITTEYGFHSGYRTTWRWPVVEPEGFIFPDEPLFRRWRVFVTNPQTRDYLVCPCCGYPHLEEERAEIIDCPLCGWPVFLILHSSLPDLDEPLFADANGNQESWPTTLRASRRYFAAHGDAFPPTDERHTRWLRHPEVAALRRQVIAEFDRWLADPDRDAHPLPDENWTRLEWVPRSI